jgi:hypothetical protein
VGIDDKEVEVRLRERLLYADAIEARAWFVRPGVGHRVLPEACRTVPALRRPDAFGWLADVPEMRRNGGADLRAHALIGAQQRQIAVGRARGKNLDHADVVEVAEAIDDLPAERIEVVERSGKEVVPEARRLGEVGLAGLDKERLILAGSDDLPRHVLRELGEEERMSKLLEQNRRDVDIEIGRNAVAFEIRKHAQQGKVGLGGSFVQPLHAVRPGAVVHHPGQVRMQHKSQEACRSLAFLRHSQPQRMEDTGFRCWMPSESCPAALRQPFEMPGGAGRFP